MAIFNDAEGVSAGAVSLLLGLAQDKAGSFAIWLSDGSTPCQLYKRSKYATLLAQGSDKRAIFEWLCKDDLDLRSAGVIPAGELHVFADSAAAGKVQGKA
jgi:6-phosphogluconolactonase/glucosamine-6-phosphate isomerase/deaminase